MSSFPIKIASLAGRGYGVIATKVLKPRMVILQEHPVARVDKTPGSPEARSNPTCIKLMNRVQEMAKSGQFNPRSEFGMWPSDVVKCFEGILDEQSKMAYEKLDEKKQKAWMALADVHAKDEDSKTPGGIIRTNAIDDADNFANLYPELSRMNHSCAPNAMRLSSDRQGGVTVVANQDIKEGDEVCINYMDGADDGLPVEQRRKHLMQQYHFHCSCKLCMEQE